MANEKTKTNIFRIDRQSRRHRMNVSGPVRFFIVIVAVIFLMSIFFRVEVISVEGNRHYTDSEIINAVDIEEGDNLFFFDRFAAVGRAFSKLPYIDQLTISRSLPNRVTITVEESEALACIVVGDEYWTLDENCKILGKATEEELEDLIMITGIDPGTLMIGEKLVTKDGDEELVAFLARVLFNIEERGLKNGVTYVSFDNPKNVKFDYLDNFTVVFGGSDNIDYRFGMLMSAFSQLTLNDVGVVDVSSITGVHFTPG